MHDVAVGHDTLLSEGSRLGGTTWPDHVSPPSFVARTTVGGTGVGFGPADPTAQQRAAEAHETEARTPVPSGAA